MYSFGIIMDPIENINPKEDSTFSMILALQKKNNIEYIVPNTMHLINQKIFAKVKKMHVFKRKNKFFMLSKSRLMDLSKLLKIAKKMTMKTYCQKCLKDLLI